MQTVVLSIGGSSINPTGEPDVAYVKTLAKIIRESKCRIGIVTGGGSSARAYAKAARALGAGEFEADTIAIVSTKQNAGLIIAGLRAEGVEVHPNVLETFEMARGANERCVVMGGTIPGITTDSDSVLLAEAIGATRLVNISNVDAIYDSDPRKNPKAKKFSKMTHKELISLAVGSDKRTAGTHFVFDMLACKLIARSKIETHFVNGAKLDDVKNAIEGKMHGGTIVKG